MVGRRSKGPRGDNKLINHGLNEYDNIILLCPTHHSIVDSDEITYTVDVLKKMKRDHEKVILEKFQLGKPWDCNVSQLEYINIPRLAILAGLNGLNIDFTPVDRKPNLHSYEFELIRIMLSISELINKIHINATKLESITKFDETLVGLTISFSTTFRTKNVPCPDYLERSSKLLLGDINKGPQIYVKLNDWKVILSIDPKWITTTTAFGDLRNGIHIFAGLGTIKNIEQEKKIIMVTPLIIGTPKSEWDELLR